MDDYAELLARLDKGFFYTGAGEASDAHEQAAAAIRTLIERAETAERRKDELEEKRAEWIDRAFNLRLKLDAALQSK